MNHDHSSTLNKPRLLIVANLVTKAFKGICKETIQIADGRTPIELYNNSRNYRCKAEDFVYRGVVTIDGIAHEHYGIFGVEMNACFDIKSEDPQWLACSRGLEHSNRERLVYAKMPGPCYSKVLGNDFAPIELEGMKTFRESGFTYSAWVDVVKPSRVVTRNEVAQTLPAINHQNQLTLKQVDPFTSSRSTLPSSVTWTGRYEMIEMNSKKILESRNYLFTAKLPPPNPHIVQPRRIPVMPMPYPKPRND